MTRSNRREWNAATGLWELTVADTTITARYVISATGPYVEPKRPDIPGLETFAGKANTSRWDNNHELSGERVAMIGTGASAVQIVPEIAPITQRLDVYQRTPIWVVPKFDPAIPLRVQHAFARWPGTERLVYRALIGVTEKLLVGAVLRFERPRTQRTVRFCTRLLRDVFYKRQIPDEHADLRARLTPGYGLGCKRPAISSTYLKTFLRDDVELITDPIAEIVPTGIRTRDGRVRAVDTLILATGFHLAHEPESYVARPVRGRDGFDLETFYREHRARSYQGISMPGLPNHFMVFGPYGGTGGNWHTVPHAAGIHIVRVLQEAQRRGAHVIEAREAPAQAWTAEMVRRLERSLIKLNSCETAHSFYIDRNGDIPFLRPTSGKQALADHASFPLDDYTFTPTPRTAGPATANATDASTNNGGPIVGFVQ